MTALTADLAHGPVANGPGDKTTCLLQSCPYSFYDQKHHLNVEAIAGRHKVRVTV
jgi:hypothetical protein